MGPYPRLDQEDQTKRQLSFVKRGAVHVCVIPWLVAVSKLADIFEKKHHAQGLGVRYSHGH